MTSRLFIRAAASLVAVVSSAAAAPAAGRAAAPAAEPRPSHYVVTTTQDENPEGIAVTRDGTLYVTSAMTGAVFKGTVDDPRLRPFLPAGSDGRTGATGVHVDPWGRVLVAGAGSAALYAYSSSGQLLAKRSVPAADTFLNDFTVSGGYLYLTDSGNTIVYRAPISASGIGELSPWLTAADFPAGTTYLNGIVAKPDGSALIVADWLTERSYRIDVATRAVTVVAATGGVLNGDGLLLEGSTLYAVNNVTLPDGSWRFRVVRAELSDDWRSATISAQSDLAQVGHMPTTIARDRGRLLWVDSQFDGDPSVPPYTVDVVPGLR